MKLNTSSKKLYRAHGRRRQTRATRGDNAHQRRDAGGTRTPSRRERSTEAGHQAYRSVSFKVSEKGAVSVYGLGRFPVTLYQEQWLKLLATADEIKTFIEEKRAKLKVTGD